MNLEEIYALRKNFTIIGITGRTGSGCKEITEALKEGFSKNYPTPDEFERNNSYRKYRIVYDYAIRNFEAFTIIYYKDILTSFILTKPLSELVEFLSSEALKKEFEQTKIKTTPNYSNEVSKLRRIEELFSKLHLIASKIINIDHKKDEQLDALYDFFNSADFKDFNDSFHRCLASESIIKRNKALQIIANNLRSSGNPYKKNVSLKNIYTIAEIINDYIKSLRRKSENKVRVVIDSLRNPFEIMFFKERFSAYYTLAINRNDEERKKAIVYQFQNNVSEQEDFENIIKEEYSNENHGEFYKQNVSACIQNADIYVAFREEKKPSVDQFLDASGFTWKMQLLKIVSLIDHPGLITPSYLESCMHIAYSVKLNSGCLSRQVGAVITDQDYSVKAVGWNDPPEGHVPCNLRNTEDLLKYYDGNIGELEEFSFYEKTNENFCKAVNQYYRTQIKECRLERDDKSDLNNLHVSFCFKTIINSYEGKNQVHTRSLHAEENAFLQLAKYGGMGIQDGILFVTASPCELCSKKAYQLGIKIIYYIDPYPGIAKEHILLTGKNSPEIRIFDGVVGSAYHMLYEPLMPYKDELALILKHKIIDLTSSLKKENNSLRKQLQRQNYLMKKSKILSVRKSYSKRK
jgi:deoxycytidylate deaminase